MKKRNLLVAGLPLFALAGSIASCDGSKVDIAMISDIGKIDDGSFNQFTYEGVKQYGDEAKLKYGYYVPSEDTEQSRLDGINTFIRRGAKVVVLTGYKFEELVPDLMKNHPDVGFLLIDGAVKDPAKNVYSMAYKEQEAGYLAGYAVGLDGKYTKFGFLGGMAVPAVERFGFGFVSGLSDALTELNAAGTSTTFELQYNYTNSFASGDTEKGLAAAMYTAGAEVIFSCGGAICESVYAAAAAAGVANHKMIGVDVDQYSQHTDVYITSAEKKLQLSTHDALKSFFENNNAWPSGRAGVNATLDSKGNYVGLPTEGSSWTFTKFTKDQYNTVYKKLQNDTDYTKVSTTDAGVRVTSGKTIDTTYFSKISYGSNASGDKANQPVAAK